MLTLPFIVGLIAAYLLIAVRVLRQYERGVIFNLGSLPACAVPG